MPFTRLLSGSLFQSEPSIGLPLAQLLQVVPIAPRCSFLTAHPLVRQEDLSNLSLIPAGRWPIADDGTLTSKSVFLSGSILGY